MTTTVPRHIYCGGRIFSPWDRIGMARMEQGLAKAMRRIQPVGAPRTFLPFRDSNEQLPHGEQRSAAIYRRDIEALNRSCGIAVRLNTISADSGTLFEIGYAVGLGLPVACLLTDFVLEEAHGRVVGLMPTLDRLGVLVVNVGRNDTAGRATTYLGRQLAHERSALREFSTRAAAFLLTPSKLSDQQPLSQMFTECAGVFIDMCGGRYLWARRFGAELAELLISRGLDVTVSQREHSIESFDAKISEDLARAVSCKVACFALEGYEMHPTSAVLLGIRTALGKDNVLLCTFESEVNGPFGQSMKANLMLEHDHVRLVRNLEATCTAIETHI